ncbi:MAG: hypothetical protein PHI73_04195 [Patescibacteria group bacterium]|nr:hypothetical protein [Patescibacteria group bacterium]
MDTHSKKSYLKRFWWIFLILLLFILTILLIAIISHKPESENDEQETIQNNINDNNTEQSTDKKYPSDVIDCPADLAGILDYPFMPPGAILFLTPLGNINPPGHVIPIDHIYFESLIEDKIPLYAPANAKIVNIVEESTKSDTGEYIPTGYSISFLICKGLVLDLGSYTEISQRLQNEIKTIEGSCTYDINKEGHGRTEGSCNYDTNIKVTSGELLGYTQKKDNGFFFEVWAANYNTPVRTDINWNYAKDQRYAHAMCLFDLYRGDLRDQYFSKFGIYLSQREETINGKSVIIPQDFMARTAEPICGEIIQDIVGTIQGVWWGDDPEIDYQTKALAVVHYNMDPSIGIFSIDNSLTGTYPVIMFFPKHSGTINREPSEITADGNIYCFTDDYSAEKELNREKMEGKILVQLINDHLLKVEHQDGSCGSDESFISPAEYQR